MSSSFLLALASLATALHPYEAVEPHMGTLVRIKLYASSEAQAQEAFRAAFNRIAQIDHELSDYQPDSEINRLARTAAGKPQPASIDVVRVAAHAEQLSKETDGAFDLTIGPLTHLWREARKKKQLPSPEAIADARERCGYRKLHVDAGKDTVAFDQPDMQLDAGAIAKGYAADEALAVLKQRGIHSALVAASGDLAFSDAPPDEPGWKIGIDSVDEAQAPFTRVVFLTNAAVSTSGPSEQHLVIGDREYSHILDPRSGFGLTHDLTVTVIARRGIDADPLATAISVLGAKRGIALIDRKPKTAALVLDQVNGRAVTIESARFQELQGAR